MDNETKFYGKYKQLLQDTTENNIDFSPRISEEQCILFWNGLTETQRLMMIFTLWLFTKNFTVREANFSDRDVKTSN